MRFNDITRLFLGPYSPGLTGNQTAMMKFALPLLAFITFLSTSCKANAIPPHQLGTRAFWSGWNPLGNTSTILTSDPIIESWGPLRLDPFGRGQDSDLLHTWWDGE